MSLATAEKPDEPAPRPDSDSSVHGRFLPGTKIVDRYRIVSLVGRGGMGEVYRADDLRLGHPVALKFLPRNVEEGSRGFALFLNEVRLSRQIAHPNVCRVYDIDDVDGQQFLSMEYIDGEDLRGLLRRIGRLPNDKGIRAPCGRSTQDAEALRRRFVIPGPATVSPPASRLTSARAPHLPGGAYGFDRPRQ